MSFTKRVAAQPEYRRLLVVSDTRAHASQLNKPIVEKGRELGQTFDIEFFNYAPEKYPDADKLAKTAKAGKYDGVVFYHPLLLESHKPMQEVVRQLKLHVPNMPVFIQDTCRGNDTVFKPYREAKVKCFGWDNPVETVLASVLTQQLHASVYRKA